MFAALIIPTGMICGLIAALPVSFIVFRVLSGGTVDLTMLLIPMFSTASIAIFYALVRVRGPSYTKAVLIPLIAWILIFEALISQIIFQPLVLMGYLFTAVVVSAVYWVGVGILRVVRRHLFLPDDPQPVES